MKHVVANFSGGLTDIGIGDNPVALDCLNFHVNEDGSLVVRDGSDFTFDQLPSGEHRVAWMGKHEGSYFAVCAKNVYVWSGTAWDTLTPFGVSDSVFAYADYDSVVSAAVVGRDLILCTSPGVGDSGANVPMRIIYVDAMTGWAGGWTAFPLGLPPLSVRFSTSGYVYSSADQTSPVVHPENADSVVNFGACFYYSVVSRGRQRDFYGPLHSWQLPTINGSLTTYHYQNKDPAGNSEVNEFLYYLPRMGSLSLYGFFNEWSNGSGDRYPSTLMKVALFRSKTNSSQLYWYYSLDNTQSELDAYSSEAYNESWYQVYFYGNATNGIDPSLAPYLGFDRWATPAPFVDGQVEFDGCPPMESISECNGFLVGAGVKEVAWSTSCLISGTLYGGWSRSYTYRSERVRQSVPGLPDIWPRSFYVDLDSTCTAVGGANGVGFAFTAFKTYRLDGAYDQFGSGGLRKKLLSDGSGCGSFASILRFGQSLYWLGDDGFYQSNGVEVAPISLRMRTRFGGRICRSAVADPVGRRMFWVLDNGTFVCYPDYGLDPQNKCFVEWGGDEFHNACMLPDGLYLFRGRTDGQFVLHGQNMGDCDVAFEAIYRTPYVGFGDPIAAKSQPRVDVLVDNVGLPYTVNLHSYRDSAAGDVYTAVDRINVSSAAQSSEGPFALTRGVVPYKRYLRSNDLRCHSRSMRVALRGAVLSSSDDGITCTYLGIVGGYPTFRLSENAPASIVVGSLLFVNGSITPLEVCQVSSDTLSVRSSVDLAVDQTATTWSVHGPIPSGVGLHGIVLHYVGSSDNLQGGES